MAYDVKFAHGKKANVESALAAGKIGEDDFIVFSDTDDELGFVNHDNEVKRIKSRTNEDYTLNGTSLGALKDGDTIPAGTSIDDFIKMIITKPVHPEYIKPSIKIESSNKNKVYEIGSTVNTILTATFTKNDAGELKNISLSTGDSSEESPIVQEYEFEIESGNNVFSAIASFEEGAVKKNNLGEYDDTNSIKAGEVSCDETLFVGGYRYFYGWSVGSNITNDDMDSSIGIKKNDEIVINIPVGARTFGFAYPCSIGEVSKVEYVEVNDSSMKDNFDVSTFEYVLPNGSTEQYYLYSYTMAVGAMAKMTMKVTL